MDKPMIGRNDDIHGNSNIHIEVTGGKSAGAIVAWVQVELQDGRIFSTMGSAKLDPEDKWNAEIGEHLAVGRALNHLGSRMIRRADGLVTEADNLRADRKTKPTDRQVKKARKQAAKAAQAREKRIAN